MTPQPRLAGGETKESEKEGNAIVEADTENVESDTAGNTTEGASDSSGSLGESGDDQSVEGTGSTKTTRRIDVSRLVTFGVLPGLALLLALAAGYLKWQDSSVRDSQVAGVESVAAAKDGAVAILSYRADTVEKDLGAARDRLTGTFKDAYTELTNDVVIPGSKQQQISAVATVPAVASSSATESHAVVLVFVNQTVVVGKDAPSAAASSVRVTLDKVGSRWLISGFDPV